MRMPPDRGEPNEPVELKLFGKSQIFNEGRPRHKVRVEYVSLFKVGTRLKLSFEAASMSRECDLRGNRSAWLQLALTNGRGREITAYDNMAVASVSESGGYQPHNDIDVTSHFDETLVVSAKGYRIRMPGRVKC